MGSAGLRYWLTWGSEELFQAECQARAYAEPMQVPSRIVLEGVNQATVLCNRE